MLPIFLAWARKPVTATSKVPNKDILALHCLLLCGEINMAIIDKFFTTSEKFEAILF
jgi:hypothetical protein